MKTQTLVQDTAQVIRVVTLAQGDTYKRVLPKTTYADAKLAFGVITAVLNNGETVAVTALEVEYDGYGTPAVRSRTFTGDDDVQLFPAARLEVLAHREDVLRALRRAKDAAQSSLEEATRRLEHTEDVYGAMLRSELAGGDAPLALEDEA